MVEHRGSTVKVAPMLGRGFAKWHNDDLQDTRLKLIDCLPRDYLTRVTKFGILLVCFMMTRTNVPLIVITHSLKANWHKWLECNKV